MSFWTIPFVQEFSVESNVPGVTRIAVALIAGVAAVAGAALQLLNAHDGVPTALSEEVRQLSESDGACPFEELSAIHLQVQWQPLFPGNGSPAADISSSNA